MDNDMGFYNKYIFLNNSYLTKHIARKTFIENKKKVQNVNKIIDNEINSELSKQMIRNSLVTLKRNMYLNTNKKIIEKDTSIFTKTKTVTTEFSTPHIELKDKQTNTNKISCNEAKSLNKFDKSTNTTPKSIRKFNSNNATLTKRIEKCI